jgi:dolichol-phosphate mannosyltransferase
MTNDLPKDPLALSEAGSETESQLDLTIVVPCLNEVENIIGTLDNVYMTLKDQALKYEIIVVDDVSEDDTFAVATSGPKTQRPDPD